MGRKHDYHYQQILIASFCHTARLPDWLGGQRGMSDRMDVSTYCVLNSTTAGGEGGGVISSIIIINYCM